MTEFTYFPPPAVLAGAAAAVAVVVGVSYGFARGRAPLSLRLFLAVIRWALIAALAVCLMDPQWVEKLLHPPKARVAVLLDASKRMSTKDVPTSRFESGRDSGTSR